MNNLQTGTIPQTAPMLINRQKGKTVHFTTVLEPYRQHPRVRGIARLANGGVRVQLADQTVHEYSWEKLETDD